MPSKVKSFLPKRKWESDWARIKSFALVQVWRKYRHDVAAFDVDSGLRQSQLRMLLFPSSWQVPTEHWLQDEHRRAGGSGCRVGKLGRQMFKPWNFGGKNFVAVFVSQKSLYLYWYHFNIVASCLVTFTHLPFRLYVWFILPRFKSLCLICH